jgi:hypothetical protein
MYTFIYLILRVKHRRGCKKRPFINDLKQIWQVFDSTFTIFKVVQCLGYAASSKELLGLFSTRPAWTLATSMQSGVYNGPVSPGSDITAISLSKKGE